MTQSQREGGEWPRICEASSPGRSPMSGAGEESCVARGSDKQEMNAGKAEVPSESLEGEGADGAEAFSSEVRELAETWPRALIAEGWAEGLADWWIQSQARSISAGGAPFATVGFSAGLGQALFEARRSRRLVRGLEGAEAALAAQEVGLSQAAAAQTQSGKPRVSRLLVVSQDGSPRFYHQVERLQARFAQRLQVLQVECDEEALGYAILGGSQRARAIMLDHKEAVVQLLETLIAEMSEEASSEAGADAESLDPSAPQ